MISKLFSPSLLMLLLMSVQATAQNQKLPCLESRAECVQQLTAAALAESEVVQVLDQAIKLNKKKLWTNYLAANTGLARGKFLAVLPMAFQLARNIAGGGDIAQGKLAIAQLRAQRITIEDTTRSAILQNLTDYETAGRNEAATRDQLTAHLRRLQIIEVSYRAGDVTTDEVLALYAQSEQLRAQIESARAAGHAAQVKLREMVAPSRLKSTLAGK